VDVDDDGGWGLGSEVGVWWGRKWESGREERAKTEEIVNM
jgi:hypothetical protein